MAIVAPLPWSERLDLADEVVAARAQAAVELLREVAAARLLSDAPARLSEEAKAPAHHEGSRKPRPGSGPDAASTSTG